MITRAVRRLAIATRSAAVAIGFGCRVYLDIYVPWGDSVAEWLACWTQVQKGLGSNRSCDAVR